MFCPPTHPFLFFFLAFLVLVALVASRQGGVRALLLCFGPGPVAAVGPPFVWARGSSATVSSLFLLALLSFWSADSWCSLQFLCLAIMIPFCMVCWFLFPGLLWSCFSGLLRSCFSGLLWSLFLSCFLFPALVPVTGLLWSLFSSPVSRLCWFSRVSPVSLVCSGYCCCSFLSVALAN